MLIISLLLAVAVFLVLWAAFGTPKMYGSQLKKLQEGSRLNKKKGMFSLSGLLPFTQQILEKYKLEGKVKSRIDAAHVRITPLEFFNIKLSLMAGLAVLSFFVTGKLEPSYLVVGAAVGYILPDFWLNQKIKKRRFAISRTVPETVDLLALCVEAGLDFITAAKWIVSKATPNPMTEELELVLEEIKWGKPHTQALKDMARRLNIPSVSSFSQTLIHAERMGTPVVEAFAILSEDTRMQRFREGERFALQAPLKILLPLIFCILPVIGIIIGAPILLQFTQGGLIKSF